MVLALPFHFQKDFHLFLAKALIFVHVFKKQWKLISYKDIQFQAFTMYRSGTLNSNTVNLKFDLI